MANLGTWRSPLGLRLGGNSQERVSRLYTTIISNIGDGLSHEPGAVNSADDIAAARLVAIADRAIDRWIAQSDPSKLTTLLARWEQALGIVSGPDDYDLDRRNRVASVLVGAPSNTHGALSLSIAAAISPWGFEIIYVDALSATMHWPGTGDPLEWSSTTAWVLCEILRPAAATVDDINKRVAAASQILDARIPAWCDYTVTSSVAP